jgi:hypothetical protein
MTRRTGRSFALLSVCVLLAGGCAVARGGLFGAASPDAGSRDAGDPTDLGTADAGDPTDLGTADAGDPTDLGTADAGDPTDLGTADAGDPTDLGPPDLGPPMCDPVVCPGRVCAADACGFALSCAELLAAVPGLPDGLYAVDGDGAGELDPAQAWCDMTTNGGGWTLVLKADGTRPTFSYDAAEWTDDTEFGDAALDANEAKLRAFRNVAFSTVRLVLVTGADGRAVEFSAPMASARALFADPTRDTGISKSTWLSLVPGSLLQDDCNDEGINVAPAGGFARVRLGIVGNNEGNCNTPDSWLGLGGAGGSDGEFAVGNVNPDDTWSWGDQTRRIASFAYLFVR